MMNPPVTLKPQENGNAFKQLVALDGNDYQFHRPFPYESGQEGKRHDNDPGGDEVQPQGEFCIAGSLDNADGNRHLVRHTDHDDAHDDYKMIRQHHGFRRQPVHGQKRCPNHIENQRQQKSDADVDHGQGPGIGANPFQIACANTVADHNGRSRGQCGNDDFQILIEGRGYGVGGNSVRGQMA